MIPQRYKWALRRKLVSVSRLKELAKVIQLQPPLANHHGVTLDFAKKFYMCPGGRHAGIDYGLAGLQPELYAVGDGHIEKQGRLSDGTPFLTLRLNTPYHDEPFWAIYYHVAEHLLEVGYEVRAGDIMGKMAFYSRGRGETSTGHHLHLGIHYGQKYWQWAVNPHRFGL